MTEWTTQKLLNWVTEYFTEKDIDSPRLSAEMVLANVLGMQRIELYVNFDKTVTQPLLNKLRGLVKRAAENEPVAYLIGQAEFYSLPFKVNSDCLIPRPETELLVERAIEFLRMRQGEQAVCDLCTGSGCIAITIAVNYANSKIVATDISEQALAIAAANAQLNKVQGKISFLQGDLLTPLSEEKFDLITCNPPYVTEEEYEQLDANVKDHEPKAALIAGADGLDYYRRLAESVEKFLKPGALLIMEIGNQQSQPVKELFEKTGCFSQVTVEKDFAGNDRVISAIKK